MLFSYDPYEVEFLVARRAAEATRSREGGSRRRAPAAGASRMPGPPHRALIAFRVLVDGEFAVRVAESLASNGVDAGSAERVAGRP